MKKTTRLSTASLLACFMSLTLVGQIQIPAKVETNKTQQEITQRKIGELTLREPSLYVYDEYVNEGAYPMYFIEDFTGKGSNIVHRQGGVQGIGADRKGNVYEVVYVGPSAKPYIKDIRKPGEFTGPLKFPTAVACDKQGRIYITDRELGQVIRIDNLDGANLVTFGTTGSGIGQFKNPSGIAIDKDGRIYIADMANNRIVRINDMAGEGWVTYNGMQYGGQALQVDFVKDIAVDSKNRIYYIYADKVIRVDDMNGSNVKFFGGYSNGASSAKLLYNGTGIAIDYADRIYISDMEGRCLIRINDIEGNGRTLLYKSTNGQSLFRRPSHVVVYFPVAEKVNIR
jgi:streptogramin lyase